MLGTDFTLFRADGSLAGVVEAKRVSDVSAEWAALFRRNLLASGAFSAEFFLIVTPDFIYLWRNAGGAPVPVAPHVVIPTQPLLEPYLERSHRSLDEISGLGFETVVWIWLSDLSEPGSEEARFANEHGLAGTGLVEALHGGRIDYEVAA